jgi:hypothetical protein
VDRETGAPVLARAGGRGAARRAAGAAAGALAAALCLAQAPGAWAADAGSAPRGLDIRSARVFLVGDTLSVGVKLGGFFSDRVGGSLERGMPATLLVTADLWRDRAGWFDRLEATRSVLWRVRYDAWRGDYDLRRGAEPVLHADSLGAVAALLSRPLRLPVARARDLPPGHRYYVVVTASLRPLTPEGVREVEQFLSTQLRSSGGAGAGGSGSVSIGRLPSSLLSALAALSGLGDEMVVHRTPAFVLPAATAATRPGESP